MRYLQASVEAAFTRLERAVDKHGSFKRKGEASATISRLGYTTHVVVTLVGSRKRPVRISGDGDTLDEAVDNLIDRLDTWAQAIV